MSIQTLMSARVQLHSCSVDLVTRLKLININFFMIYLICLCYKYSSFSKHILLFTIVQRQNCALGKIIWNKKNTYFSKLRKIGVPGVFLVRNGSGGKKVSILCDCLNSNTGFAMLYNILSNTYHIVQDGSLLNIILIFSLLVINLTRFINRWFYW